MKKKVSEISVPKGAILLITGYEFSCPNCGKEGFTEDSFANHHQDCTYDLFAGTPEPWSVVQIKKRTYLVIERLLMPNTKNPALRLVHLNPRDLEMPNSSYSYMFRPEKEILVKNFAGWELLAETTTLPNPLRKIGLLSWDYQRQEVRPMELGEQIRRYGQYHIAENTSLRGSSIHWLDIADMLHPTYKYKFGDMVEFDGLTLAVERVLENTFDEAGSPCYNFKVLDVSIDHIRRHLRGTKAERGRTLSLSEAMLTQ